MAGGKMKGKAGKAKAVTNKARWLPHLAALRSPPRRTRRAACSSVCATLTTRRRRLAAPRRSARAAATRATARAP
jgi:hypothetical protein